MSDADQAAVDQVLRDNVSVREAQGTEMRFTEPRAAMGSLDVFEAAVFAEARTIVDWNARNKVRVSFAVRVRLPTRLLPPSEICSGLTQ